MKYGAVSQHISVDMLQKEMQARPELRKSLEEFRKKPFMMRNKEKEFSEVLKEEKEKLE